MLYTIAVVLLILWLLGLVSAYTIGGFKRGQQLGRAPDDGPADHCCEPSQVRRYNRRVLRRNAGCSM